MKWYEDVYRRRLAGASGHFVFGVAEELGRGELIVPCGRQARGCSLRLAHAVTRQERGAWRLDWRGALAGYGAPPASPPLGRRLLRRGPVRQDQAGRRRRSQSSSSGLLTPRPPRFRTCVYICVVSTLVWPSSSCTFRMS